MSRIIMHIDLDAFFAAVEQREHPEWQGKPVVVGADPKKGAGRGVVSTASYEARKFGISSAMPISQAYKLCPAAIFTRPDFKLYSAASEAVMGILRRHSGKFEQVGIDEAFIDVTGRVKDNTEESALKLKKEVKEKQKLTCSVGVATNKLVAKIASDFRKPDGLTVVKEGGEKQFLAGLPIRKLTGIGAKTEEALKKQGINTISQLAALSPDKLHEQFGKFGLYLHSRAAGIDNSEVSEQAHEPKSINRNHTFEQDTKDKTIILAAVDEMMEDAHKTLLRNNLCCKTAGIRVRYQDFETHTKERTLEGATTDFNVMLQTIKHLLEGFLKDEKKIRLVGIRMAGLQQQDMRQRLIKDYYT